MSLHELEHSQLSVEDDYMETENHSRNRSKAEADLKEGFAIKELDEVLEQSSDEEGKEDV